MCCRAPFRTVTPTLNIGKAEDQAENTALRRRSRATRLRMILKPQTGVCVLYGPDINEEGVSQLIRRSRIGSAEVRWEPCNVDVPFVVPEWQALGVGRHTIQIPWFRLVS